MTLSLNLKKGSEARMAVSEPFFITLPAFSVNLPFWEKKVKMANENLPYIHRDISWMSFNYRVLQEAKDKSVPLFERLKFLAIYSNNIGEFFQVRMATIRNVLRAGKKTKRQLDFDPKTVIKEILRIANEHQVEYSQIFEEIISEMNDYGIHLITNYRILVLITNFLS